MAAKRLFLEEGVERTTMRRIAAMVGVSPTALYVYFADKEAILRAIAGQTFEDLLAFLEASEHVGGSAMDRFRAGLRAYVEFGRSRPDEYRLTFLAKMIRVPVPGRVCEPIEAADRSFAFLEQAIAGLMRDGIFAPAPTSLVAEAVWACMHGLTCLLLDRVERLESDHETLIDTIIEMTIRGLRVST